MKQMNLDILKNTLSKADIQNLVDTKTHRIQRKDIAIFNRRDLHQKCDISKELLKENRNLSQDIENLRKSQDILKWDIEVQKQENILISKKKEQI